MEELPSNSGKKPVQPFVVNGIKFPISLARVWSLLISGYTSKEGAAVLGIQPTTYNSHKQRIKDRVQICKSAALAAHGVAHGFDTKGNFKGFYLFEGKGDLEW